MKVCHDCKTPNSCRFEETCIDMKHGGKRKGSGRPPSGDPRKPLPFRIKSSLCDKAKRLGRDRIEQMIQDANENQTTP
jgi:hypothetical protein